MKVPALHRGRLGAPNAAGLSPRAAKPCPRPCGCPAGPPSGIDDHASARRALTPQILHWPGWARWGRRARVRSRQPVAELSRGFDRRRTVEGHQRGRHTRDPDDVGPPPILRDMGDLDEIRASCDGFFEAMNGGDHSVRCGCGSGANCTHRPAPIKRSERRKRADTEPISVFPSAADLKKISTGGSCTGNSPVINRFSTA